MEQKRTDTASEPVEPQEDNEFMDTGVLHERRRELEDEDEAE